MKKYTKIVLITFFGFLLTGCWEPEDPTNHKQKGLEFLKKNKTLPGVIQTESGLQYKIISEGNGIKPNKNSRVTVHYVGTLIDGEVFDSSFQIGEPATFKLSEVIRGWTEGLQLMNTGSKYKFFIPYYLGYGEIEQGGIPAYSTLIFEVQLIEVN